MMTRYFLLLGIILCFLFPQIQAQRPNVSNTPHREYKHWVHEGNRAIRVGDWKLVSKWNNNSQWELYDIAKDRSELNDLAEQYPERTREMAGMWQAYAERAFLLPWPEYLIKKKGNKN